MLLNDAQRKKKKAVTPNDMMTKKSIALEFNFLPSDFRVRVFIFQDAHSVDHILIPSIPRMDNAVDAGDCDFHVHCFHLLFDGLIIAKEIQVVKFFSPG
jgi:hypothetical protein